LVLGCCSAELSVCHVLLLQGQALAAAVLAQRLQRQLYGQAKKYH
jgi:hypothetical protein